MAEQTEQLFNTLDQMATAISQNIEYTYLDALAEAGDILFHGKVREDLPESLQKNLERLLANAPQDDVDRETVRKAFQLAILKGMKENVQPHHAMTPDGVALFVSYLLKKLIADDKDIRLLDPAMGTANLLTAILNETDQIATVIGAEVDDSLVRVAYAMSNLQRHSLQLLQMDSIRQQGFPEVDAIVSDLPVGYYPHDEVVADFQTRPEQGRMPSEYALFENSWQALKEGGVAIYLIPNTMFTREGAEFLHNFVKNEAVTLGLLQLPETMFKNEQHAKSIWLLQKNGPGVQAPPQALFAELPSFSRAEALSDMVERINEWFEQFFDK
ncbi:class I SAM-dependent methyltransferase [Natribacillus halophilus]|uniref:Site-specific DNA-methyltransferase (Adenine-specific) n=1 Tax=Natribacillus halophilus TaxID=549003 RepID=A0A1G8NDS4_9BACI|nr:class I SAM-dependent methyltransferase [Natribacillus halophilus]SDI78313.1 site-specific DNA-methyltransferase (adenine-specific) [Natribacillus halophilus]